MITLDNLEAVVNLITVKDRKRINNSHKEHCILTLHTFNAGSVVNVTLTNKFKNAINKSNLIANFSILELWLMQEIIK